MRKLKEITTGPLEIDHQDNLVTSTKAWIQEIRRDINQDNVMSTKAWIKEIRRDINESRRIQTIRYG